MPVLIDYAAIKAAVPMERVLAAYGIDVKRGKAICPFHADKRPSMKVYADGYYCFACGNGGDAIKFVARMDHLPNHSAAQRVAEIGGLALAESDYRGRERARRIAAARRAAERRMEQMQAEYRTLCDDRHKLLREVEFGIPLSDEWCAAVCRLERIEVELDGLFEWIAANG
jgi:hypothetical protein|nr:MAG TPA: DNA primase, catalytic core [Myoviridae sp. ct6nn14]